MSRELSRDEAINMADALLVKSWAMEAFFYDIMTPSLAKRIKVLRTGADSGIIISYRFLAERLYDEIPMTKPETWYPKHLQSAGTMACKVAAEALGEKEPDWI